MRNATERVEGGGVPAERVGGVEAQQQAPRHPMPRLRQPLFRGAAPAACDHVCGMGVGLTPESLVGTKNRKMANQIPCQFFCSKEKFFEAKKGCESETLY